jgi:hypothetical protein
MSGDIPQEMKKYHKELEYSNRLFKDSHSVDRTSRPDSKM